MKDFYTVIRAIEYDQIRIKPGTTVEKLSDWKNIDTNVKISNFKIAGRKTVLPLLFDEVKMIESNH